MSDSDNSEDERRQHSLRRLDRYKRMLRTSSNASSARNRSREREERPEGSPPSHREREGPLRGSQPSHRVSIQEIDKLLSDSRPNVRALGSKLAQIYASPANAPILPPMKVEVPNFLELAPSSAAAVKTEAGTTARSLDSHFGPDAMLYMQQHSVEVVGALTALKVSNELLTDRVKHSNRSSAQHALKLSLVNAEKALSCVKKLYERTTFSTSSAMVDDPTRFRLASETPASDDFNVNRIRVVQEAAQKIYNLKLKLDRAKGFLEMIKSTLDEAYYKEESDYRLHAVSKATNEALELAAGVQMVFLGVERANREFERSKQGGDLTNELLDQFKKLRTGEADS